MAAGRYDLTIEQGATFKRSLTWKTSTATPVNVTGYTARMRVKNKVGGTTVLHLTTENGGITLGGAAGTISLLATATQTSAIAIKKGVYDLELASNAATPEVTRLISGQVVLSPEVTT
jgi:hypothetical protein